MFRRARLVMAIDASLAEAMVGERSERGLAKDVVAMVDDE